MAKKKGGYNAPMPKQPKPKKGGRDPSGGRGHMTTNPPKIKKPPENGFMP